MQSVAITANDDSATNTGMYNTNIEDSEIETISAMMMIDSKKKVLVSFDMADTRQNPFRNACGAMSMYISKVAEFPEVPQYRRITISNASFRSLVEPLKHHDLVLGDVGFCTIHNSNSSRNNKGYEWNWAAAADTNYI